MALIYDLWIVEGDLDFGPDGEPLFLADAHAIAQDVKHRLEERGLTVALVSEDGDPKAAHRRIALEVEEDTRIRPGTASVTAAGGGAFTTRAATLSGDEIALTLTA
jgi:hypothetical protein